MNGYTWEKIAFGTLFAFPYDEANTFRVRTAEI